MSETEFHHGDMDVSQQRATWEGFVGMVKWATLAMAFLTIVAVIVVQ